MPLVTAITTSPTSSTTYGTVATFQPLNNTAASGSAEFELVGNRKLINKLLQLRAEVLQEIKNVDKANTVTGLTIGLAALEVLWGFAEAASGLLSKVFFALTSCEESVAESLVWSSGQKYKSQLERRLIEINELLGQLNGGTGELTEAQVNLLKAVLNDDKKAIFHSPDNESANKIVAGLQLGLGLMMGWLSWLKVKHRNTEEKPIAFLNFKNHPIPKAIGEFKNRLFGFIPHEGFRNVFEVGIMSLAMILTGKIKDGLAQNLIDEDFKSVMKQQSLANWICALEAAPHAIPEGSSLKKSLPWLYKLLPKNLQQIGQMGFQTLLEIPLCIWSSVSYLVSSIQTLLSESSAESKLQSSLTSKK